MSIHEQCPVISTLFAVEENHVFRKIYNLGILLKVCCINNRWRLSQITQFTIYRDQVCQTKLHEGWRYDLVKGRLKKTSDENEHTQLGDLKDMENRKQLNHEEIMPAYHPIVS